MQRLIEYFDRAYLINLPDRTDRLRSAKREFAKIGVEFPSDRVRLHYGERPSERRGVYAIGARGSFCSHRSVLREAEKQRLKNVLVFEDDVFFRPPAEGEVDRILSALSEVEWDIVYFGYLSPSDRGLSGPLFKDPPLTIGGHFYAVNGPFISRMREYMDQCEMRPVGHPDGGPMGRDGAYNHIRLISPDIRVYLAVPNLARQKSSRSDIADLRLWDRLTFIRPAVSFARIIKNKLLY